MIDTDIHEFRFSDSDIAKATKEIAHTNHSVADFPEMHEVKNQTLQLSDEYVFSFSSNSVIKK